MEVNFTLKPRFRRAIVTFYHEGIPKAAMRKECSLQTVKTFRRFEKNLLKTTFVVSVVCTEGVFLTKLEQSPFFGSMTISVSCDSLIGSYMNVININVINVRSSMCRGKTAGHFLVCCCGSTRAGKCDNDVISVVRK